MRRPAQRHNKTKKTWGSPGTPDREVEIECSCGELLTSSGTDADKDADFMWDVHLQTS